jgi:hypothetical protein
MPEFSDEKGLLPGRGPVGRAAVPPAGRAGAVLAAGARGSISEGAAGALGATTVSATAAAAGASGAATGSAAAAAFLAGALGVGGLGAASGAGKISRSLRTTGGSTVDDAERTNSPSSVSLVMTTLLSMPSSFASS